MATIRVLDGTGHTALDYDLKEEDAVREAERIFEDARKRGATAFRTDCSPAIKLERFDPTAEQITVVPRVAGGM